MGVIIRVTKGIVFSFILHLLLAVFIVYTDFNMTIENFSVVLALLMACITFFAGIASKRLAPVEGTIISLGTVLFLLLYLNQRVEMNWELNRYLIGIYILIGFLFSFLGSLLRKKRNKKGTEKESKIEVGGKRAINIKGIFKKSA